MTTASIPFAVNGSVHPGHDDWSVFVSNIGRSGQTVPWGGTIWFVLDGADRVRRGTVGVDLSTALSGAGNLLQTTYGWTDFRQTYWLDTVPFGMEFGPGSAAPYDSGPTALLLHPLVLLPRAGRDGGRPGLLRDRGRDGAGAGVALGGRADLDGRCRRRPVAVVDGVARLEGVGRGQESGGRPHRHGQAQGGGQGRHPQRQAAAADLA